MSIRQPHRVRTSVAGAALGLVAVAILSAIIGGALAAFRANNTVGALVGQLGDAQHQIQELRDDNGRLENQNRQILDQNRALVTYLRRHGLAIPQTAVTPPAAPPSSLPLTRPPDADPKAPTTSGPAASPTHRPPPPPAPTPATPGPTATLTPPVPGLEGLCVIAPILCRP